METEIERKIREINDEFDEVDVKVSDNGQDIIVENRVFRNNKGDSFKDRYNKEVLNFIIGYLRGELNDFDEDKFKDKYEL